MERNRNVYILMSNNNKMLKLHVKVEVKLTWAEKREDKEVRKKW
jgi:hypothetical protein